MQWLNTFIKIVRNHGWLLPEGHPCTQHSKVLVGCPHHKDLASIGDPAVTTEGYYFWRPTAGKVIQGRSCRACSNLLLVSQERVEWKLKRDGRATLRKDQTVTNSETLLKLDCLECGREYFAQAGWIMKSSDSRDRRRYYGCSVCGHKRGGAKIRVARQVWMRRCKKLRYKDVVPKYENGVLVLAYTCSGSTRHTQPWNQMRTMGCGCLTKVSSFEHLVLQLVQKVTGRKWGKIYKRELIALTQMKDAPHEFDLFCRETKQGIEVDSDLHLKPDVRKRDRAKDAWHRRAFGTSTIRLREGWLVRLKTASASKQVRLMRDVLELHAVECLAEVTRFRAKHNLPWHTAGLMELEKLAETYNCALVSARYLGMNIKHWFYCAEHGRFARTPTSMKINNGGCQKCGYKRKGQSVGQILINKSKEKFLSLCADSFELVGGFRGTAHTVRCKCLRHDVVFPTRVKNCLRVQRITGCSVCTRERQRKSARLRWHNRTARKLPSGKFVTVSLGPANDNARRRVARVKR